MKKPAIIIGLVLFLMALPIGVLLVMPPWHNSSSAVVHNWLCETIGLRLHSFDDYTGPVRYWDDQGRLCTEYMVKDGLRHGRWVEYDERGEVTIEGEYRDDEPWDGICYPIDMKGFIGEYKAGKPWNGCLPAFDEEEQRTTWRLYRDGVRESEEEYQRRTPGGTGS